MDVRFQKKFDKIELCRTDLLQKLENIDLEKLNLKPYENKWSIIQIIFHIVKTEHLSIISVEKNLKNFYSDRQNVSSANILSSIKYNFLILMLKSPVKMKAPKILAGIPDTYNFENLIIKWKTLRNNFKNILEHFPQRLDNIIFFTHPYGTNLTINQTLDFLYIHLECHKKQIINILGTTFREK